MADPENPERKSYAATIVFGVGAGLLTLAWFMGVGAAATGALEGGAVAIGAGLIVMLLAATLGGFLMLVGGVWMIVRVIADQTGNPEEERYRNVER